MGVLNPEQLQNAHTIYGLALKAGLAPQRAQELVYAAWRESSLRNTADNPETHAHGLMQLLSPGYRQRAQALGGLEDPVANVSAILPAYASYWHSHPDAAPGAGAAAVEASGEPASWYAPDGSLSKPLGGMGAALAARAPAAASTATQGGPRALSPLAQFALANLRSSFDHSSAPPGLGDLIAAVRAQKGPAPETGPSAPAGAPAGYTGSGGSPAPGKLDSRLVSLSHQYGLVITSGYRDPAHNADVGGAPGSYHTLGEAIDVSPTANALKFAAQARANPGHFAELFGPFPWYIKDGVLHAGQFPGHGDHVHVALAGPS